MTNEELLSVAEIVERLSARFHKQLADHEAKMAEHRAAFGARTEADAKIIEGLRADVDDLRNRMNSLGLQAAKQANIALGMVEGEGLLGAAQRVVNERDALRAEVTDLRRVFDMVHCSLGIKQGDHIGNAIAILKGERDCAKDEWARHEARCKALSADVLRLTPKFKVGDKLESYNRSLGLAIPVTVVGVRTVYDCQADGAEYPVGHSEAELKERYSQTPKHSAQHPVKMGEWVRRTTGSDSGRMAQVKSIAVLQYDVQIDGYKAFWASSNCEPCDPPEATHDTEAGKAAAEAAVKTEPVADDIKVGDLVEVVSNRGRNTWLADVGSLGTVTSVEEINDSISVRLDDVPGKQNALAGYVSLCDVRKVTT